MQILAKALKNLARITVNRMKSITITKEHIDKTIAAITTWSNSRFHGDIKTFYVHSVARKYATLSSDGNVTNAKRYTVDRGISEESVRAGYSSEGYLWFESVKDANEYSDYTRKLNKVMCFLRGTYNLEAKIGQNKVLAIYEIIKEFIEV